MVKPDVKRDYYADLELAKDVSVDDVKKQYRKLALKYHPDRNPGKESEFSQKFQTIQAAHEVLSDTATKAKYDADRRKAGLYQPFTRPAAATASARPNPYFYPTPPPPASHWPPPPRRSATANGPWTNGNGAGAGTGTGTNATGADRFTNFPRPAPTSKKDPAADKFSAWQGMKGQAQAQSNPASRGRASQQRPDPPPRSGTRFPTEEDIRAGTKYHAAPGSFAGEHRRTRAQFSGPDSAWAQFNEQNAGKPGMNRSNTTKTPKKTGGFNPLAAEDEGQAGSTSSYNSRGRTRSDDTRTYPPPPPPSQRTPEPVPASTNRTSFRPEQDAPYTEDIRIKTPYSSHIGQQKYTSSDNLRQDHPASFANSTYGKKTSNGSQRPERPKTQQPPRPHSKFHFVDSSSDRSDSGKDSSATTPDPDIGARSKSAEKNPFLGNLFDRPKKTPTPPSKHFQSSMFNPPNESTSTRTPPAGGTNATAAGGKPSAAEPAKNKDIKYDESPESPFIPKTTMRATENTVRSQMQAPPCELQTRIPSSLWPSSIRPPKGCADTPHIEASASAGHVASATLGAHTNGHVFSDESRDYLRQRNLSSQGGHAVPHAPDPFDQLNRGFSFPITSDMFSSSAKTRSEENINTRFSTEEWAGEFGSNNVFAAAAGQAANPNSKQRRSPTRRSSRILRPQTSSHLGGTSGTPSTPQPAFPPPTTFPPTQNQAPPTPVSPPQEPFKFSADDFKDSSAWFQPDNSRPASRGGSQARKPSRSAATASGVKIPATTPKAATVEGVEEAQQHEVDPAMATAAAAEGFDSADAGSGDAMDIDSSTPPTFSASSQREPRFVPVSSSFGAQKSEKDTLKTSLNDLAASLNAPASNGAGLEGLDDISSTLPFTSKAEAKVPTRSFTPQILSLPKLPRAPDEPVRLTKASWKRYCSAMDKYVCKWHTFNTTMSQHFATRLASEDVLVKSDLSAELESIGGLAWAEYARGVEEDEKVREHWNVGSERHRDIVRTFNEVRARARELSEKGALLDV